MSVSPPDLVGEVVDRQSVWPGQVVAANGGHDSSEGVRVTIHADSADVSLQMPRSKENITNTGMNGNGTGIFNSGPQCFPVPAVLQFGNVHVLRVAVHPVELVVDPIDGDALEAVSIVVDQNLPGIVSSTNL